MVESKSGGEKKAAGMGKRGFASMDPAKQKEIASKGGRTAHARGTAHEYNSEEARVAGRKGGEAVAKDSAYMAEIGRRGGKAVSKDREHMSRIGREGGAASREARSPHDAVDEPKVEGVETDVDVRTP